MVKVLGVHLDNRKKIYIALTKIYGIGYSRSLKILNTLKINPYTKVKELKHYHIIKLIKFFSKRYFVLQGDLQYSLAKSINYLIRIKTYRGLRIQRGLPVRGQRTRTNSRTIRKLFKKNLLFSQI